MISTKNIDAVWLRNSSEVIKSIILRGEIAEAAEKALYFLSISHVLCVIN